MSYGFVEHNNWGDDLNMFFLRKITKDCLLPYKFLGYPRGEEIFPWLYGETIYSTIGSVFQSIKKEDSVVWGSGIISDQFPISKIPKEILAVRGPLSRNHLRSKGIECPEVYGDPALLLPYYYVPKVKTKRYRLGIIPHYVDYNKEELDKFRECEDVLIIKMSRYNKWTEVIDEINSCEMVLSSSLHGIIVAEAYKIPNVWVEIKEPIVGDISRRFKFYDFYSSIGKEIESPFLLEKNTDIETILSLRNHYQEARNYSIIPLVQSCPFVLKKPIKDFV